MNDLQKINSEIFDLRQQKEYQNALNVYKEKIHKKFPLEQVQSFDYLVANVMFCLRKTQQYEAAINWFNKSLQLAPSWVTHPSATAEYGWCLYFIVKNTRPDDLLIAVPDNIEKAALFLPSVNAEKDYLLFRLLFQELSRKLMLRGPAAVLLAKTLVNIDYDVFKATEEAKQVIQTQPKPENDLASDLETFLVRKAKVMLLTQQYENCLEACNQAFDLIKKFHHGNHIWLARNMAVSLQQTGNVALAIEKMEQITRKKKDWFLFAELATMHFAAGNKSKGLATICQAALQQGHSEFKAGLYEQIGMEYKEYFDKEISCKTLWLAINTRKEKGWKLPVALQDFMKDNTCEAQNKTPRQLYQQLTLEWSKIAAQNQEAAKQDASGEGLQAKGTVTRILNDGENGDGFITTNEGVGIYFRMKKVTPAGKTLTPGARVGVFARLREYNGKSVYNAIWVKILD